jgi:hypothetical protein
MKLIEMARESGAMLYDSPKNPFKLIDIMFTPETLAAFEALVRADERQAIAKWHDKSDAGSTWDSVVQEKIRTGGYLND